LAINSSEKVPTFVTGLRPLEHLLVASGIAERRKTAASQ
jgi:hypothetical protein